MGTYIAILHQEPDGASFGVSFPDFPGCITAADTIDDIRKMAHDVLAFHIKGMIEDGDPIPAPSAPERIIKSEDFDTSYATLLVTVSIGA